MTNIKLHDIVLFGYETWNVTSMNDEFIEITKVTPNYMGFHRVVKIMKAEAWKWNLCTVHTVEVPSAFLTKEQMEDLLA